MAFNHGVVLSKNIGALRGLLPQMQVVMSKHTKLPAGNLLFSIVLSSVGVRVVKHGDAYPTLGTGSRRRGWRGCGCGRRCCTRRCCRCSRSCGRSCWRRRRSYTPDLEIIRLAAVVVEVAISTHPNLVFSTWIW